MWQRGQKWPWGLLVAQRGHWPNPAEELVSKWDKSVYIWALASFHLLYSPFEPVKQAREDFLALFCQAREVWDTPKLSGKEFNGTVDPNQDHLEVWVVPDPCDSVMWQWGQKWLWCPLLWGFLMSRHGCLAKTQRKNLLQMSAVCLYVCFNSFPFFSLLFRVQQGGEDFLAMFCQVRKVWQTPKHFSCSKNQKC